MAGEKPIRKRGKQGFAQAGGVLATRIRTAGSTRGFSEARLLTHWGEVVGAEFARITRPVKVAFARAGIGATLTVETDSGHAPEVSMQLEVLRARVNACYGYNAIHKVRIVQGPGVAAGFAEEQAAYEPPPVDLKEAMPVLEDVKDPRLRTALENFSRHVLTRLDKN